MRLDKEYRPCRAVTANLLAQAHGGQDLASRLASRAVSSKATETPFTAGPALICGGLGRRSVITVLQEPPQRGTGHTRNRWYPFGHASEAVRHTETWEHENLAEEQARWERSDPAYARICEEVRQAKKKGEEASRRVEAAKAEWDARVALQRQANDDAEKAHHASKLKADQTGRRQTATSRAASEAQRPQRIIQPKRT